uniref:Uncharacterized protein n=1 Tax=Solanum tuberosum TaxID=4113 RepID=M1DE02_SOLTU
MCLKSAGWRAKSLDGDSLKRLAIPTSTAVGLTKITGQKSSNGQDRSPKVTDLEDAECQVKRAMEETKRRLTEWFGESYFFAEWAFVAYFQ